MDYRITPQFALTVVAVLIAAGFGIWLLVRDDDDDGGGNRGVKSSAEPRGPEAVSAGELRDAAAEVGHPAYWAGGDPDATYELTITDGGNIFVRYLTGAGEVGDERPEFLTVATYPHQNAYGALEVVAGEEGAQTQQNADGSLAVTNEEVPTSAHLAYPESDLQIEVYDPEPARAFEVATSGDIKPIE